MNYSSRLRRFLNAPYFVWAGLFIIIPLIIVVYFTFTNSDGAFTFSNIALIKNYTSTIWRSILYSIIATAITFVFSYPVAFFLTRTKAKTQSMMIMLVMLPMWMNLLIRTYSWVTILDNNGLVNTLLSYIGIGPVKLMYTPAAVILGMVYNYIPYMLLPIYTVMSKINKSYIEAAEDLGANKISVLKRVIIPLSIPGVISGITMVFVPSVSTFYIAQSLGGAQNTMVGDIIQQEFNNNMCSNIGAALSFVLMVIILISLAIMNRFDSEESGGMII